MEKLIEGSKAPEFYLSDQDGKDHELADYHGQWVLLYFYPKDDTPGCTQEACSLRDTFPRFEDVSAIVLGVSADSVESHKKFATKYKLPFTLLADPDKKVIQAYGVWREKSMYGKSFLGIARTSFLIDPDGNIAKIYEKVKPAEHARQVLHDLKELAK